MIKSAGRVEKFSDTCQLSKTHQKKKDQETSNQWINLRDNVEYSRSRNVDAMYSQRHWAQPSSYAGSQLEGSPRKNVRKMKEVTRESVRDGK
jgi:hypothetical protein